MAAIPAGASRVSKHNLLTLVCALPAAAVVLLLLLLLLLPVPAAS
jgi:hypothetical protein